jgi:hypothetical protein
MLVVPVSLEYYYLRSIDFNESMLSRRISNGTSTIKHV